MFVQAVPFCDPKDCCARLGREEWAVLLDGDASLRGSWAYVAIRPWRTLTVLDGQCLRDGEPVAGDPFALLAAETAARAPLSADCPAPFQGGAIGFLGYELGRWLERAPARHRVPPDQPDMAIGLYDAVAAFDLTARRAWVIASRDAARPTARRLEEAIRAPAPPPAPPSAPCVHWQPELEPPDYLERVRRVIGYIQAGDIFQANFTQRFLAERPAGLDDFQIYARLVRRNPAPFAAFLRCGPALSIASASPERFLALAADGWMQSRPIKGTRPRHADPELDQDSARRLRDSEKDRAENLMITDLLRNDMGRVADIGSVRVPSLCAVESFATVHHLVSVVEARLRPGLGAADLLRATFPGGSITGAPKIRAMEIIDELEPAPRGPYCGAIVWIGLDGAMDSSIVIRSLTITPKTIIAQAGGGIVADSDPGDELAEMRAKVAPALASLSAES